MASKIIIGQFKAYLKLEPVGKLNMDDYDFYVEYFCCPNRRVVVVRKNEMIRKGENEYHACLDTRRLGQGELKCIVHRTIPDADFPDGTRTESKAFEFKDVILK